MLVGTTKLSHAFPTTQAEVHAVAAVTVSAQHDTELKALGTGQWPPAAESSTCVHDVLCSARSRVLEVHEREKPADLSRVPSSTPHCDVAALALGSACWEPPAHPSPQAATMLLLSALLLVAWARGTQLRCGERPVFEGAARHSRIVGGSEAGEGEFPWQASVQARGEPFCGGSLVGEWWVLSAAHCFHGTDLTRWRTGRGGSSSACGQCDRGQVLLRGSLGAPSCRTGRPAPRPSGTALQAPGRVSLGVRGAAGDPRPSAVPSPEDLSVGLGSSDLGGESLLLRRVSRVLMHKDFQRTDMNNDIALLLLQAPVGFDGLKAPICLPGRPGPSSWRECWVAGWGQTRSGDEHSVSNDLLKAPMVITDWKECAKIFPKLTKNMLCAGYQNQSYDACQGDSGGPLACLSESDGRWYQAGIISWGRSCGQKNIPGIYTALENYSPWVQKVAGLEGRPLDARVTGPATRQRPRSAHAAPWPEPALRLLLCPLPSVLFYR
ncbi:Serine protease 55 [Galemys pyrenaicus]|uniref:Serine protease 55 n=1 Tax=Galemys pyrenaicus TaxID=202257 RepID=A0A8J6DFC4_GALPY|nr:Serine protease 55 [Galemys pyrenaicus]